MESYDVKTVIEGIKSLGGERTQETGICLLNLFLRFQMMLSALAEEPSLATREMLTTLHDEIFHLIVTLRDGILDGKDPAYAEPQVIPGIFCDLAGTLFIDENYINEPMFDWLEQQNETIPVTVWTGGDVESARKKYSHLLPWPIEDKAKYRGKIVTFVIDDQSQRSQEASYGFKALRFMRYPDDFR